MGDALHTRLAAGSTAAALALIWVVAASATDSAAGREPANSVSHPLVFTLEYVGTDYDVAVRDGAVVNEMEYGEVLRLTKQVIREYGTHGPKSDAIDTGLAELQQLIEHKAPALEVWRLTRRLVPLLSAALGGGTGPERPPNIASGRRLWANDCAVCHGPTGAGDGPAAGDMDPPPTAFRENRLDWLSPRQVFNAMSLGIEGTGMPSFVPAYSEQQRWDVAFFVMTLRVGFAPARPAEGVRLGLDELAATSNAELLDRLRQENPQASPEWVDYFRLNFFSPEGIVPLAGPDAAVAGSVAVAMQMQNAFADVAERVFPRVVGVTSYVPVSVSASDKTPAEGAGEWMIADERVNAFPGFRPFRSGSGLLVDEEGHALSSAWIVKAEGYDVAPFVDVELHDQSHLVARVVGAEPTLDLAILRIADPSEFPEIAALEFGDSDRLQAGHWLIALGDPPGPEMTFSVGVVASQPQRQCYQEAANATLVQSSLAVPAGGLGGPVVDILGHVVGLNVHPLAPESSPLPAPSRPRILPINLLLNLYEALKVAESQRSPWIGVSVLELELLRQQLGSQAQAVAIPESGVRIDDVFDPSPASRAGVRPGDFLMTMNGHMLATVADFQTWMYILGVDAQVELAVLRDGKPLRFELTIESRPASATMR